MSISQLGYEVFEDKDVVLLTLEYTMPQIHSVFYIELHLSVLVHLSLSF